VRSPLYRTVFAIFLIAILVAALAGAVNSGVAADGLLGLAGGLVVAGAIVAIIGAQRK